MKRILATLVVAGLFSTVSAQKNFTPGNLALLRYGELDVKPEGQTISLPMFIDEYTTDGKLVNSIKIKGHVGSGSSERILEGSLALSPDNSKLSFLAYKASEDELSLSMKDAREVNRVVVTVGNDYKSLNTATVLTTINGNTRTAITNGEDVWLAGNVDGINYTTLSKKPTVVQLSARPSSARTIRIFNNDIYFSTNAGSGENGAFRMQKITGLAKEAAKPAALPGFTKEGNPYDFVLFDMDATIPGPDLMYVVDDGTPSKLIKYAFDGTIWKAKGELENTLGTRKIMRGLTGTLENGKPTLYASTVTSIVKFVDNAVYTADGDFTTKVVLNKKTGTNEVFKGISFVPDTQIINTKK